MDLFVCLFIYMHYKNLCMKEFMLSQCRKQEKTMQQVHSDRSMSIMKTDKSLLKSPAHPFPIYLAERLLGRVRILTLCDLKHLTEGNR